MSEDSFICPGRYCGRLEAATEASFDSCTACPAGFRTNTSKICDRCTDNPTLYEWMYLIFMFTIPLFLNWFYIGLYLKRYKSMFVWQLLSSLFETFLSIIVSLLIFEPTGSLKLLSCRVDNLSDWYTLFYNPQIRFDRTLYCAQEAVFPLYSIVFVCYLFSLCFMAFLRPITLCKTTKEPVLKKQCRKIIYASLYFHPILLLIHAIAAGLVYYSYPYLVIVITLLAFTTYCTITNLFNWKNLRKDSLVHWMVIFWHLALLGYAEIAIANAYPPAEVGAPNTLSFIFLPIVILPMAFLFLTEKLSHPDTISGQLRGSIG